VRKAPEPAVRTAVYDAVRRYPGIHVRGLERHVGASAPLVQYHLKRLEEAGFVEAHEQGGYTRYYPTHKGKTAQVTKRDLPLVGLLREEVPLHIVLLLLDHGPQTHGALVEALGVAKSTASYHLAKLAEAGIVEREPGTHRLRLAERERMYKLLLAYRPMPDLVDAFASVWDDLYG
jgi:predicted transcriptional regulator